LTGKFIPVAYGVQKLQISCVVEDDKVGTDFLEEKITEFEDFVSKYCCKKAFLWSIPSKHIPFVNRIAFSS